MDRPTSPPSRILYLQVAKPISNVNTTTISRQHTFLLHTDKLCTSWIHSDIASTVKMSKNQISEFLKPGLRMPESRMEGPNIFCFVYDTILWQRFQKSIPSAIILGLGRIDGWTFHVNEKGQTVPFLTSKRNDNRSKFANIDSQINRSGQHSSCIHGR